MKINKKQLTLLIENLLFENAESSDNIEVVQQEILRILSNDELIESMNMLYESYDTIIGALCGEKSPFHSQIKEIEDSLDMLSSENIDSIPDELMTGSRLSKEDLKKIPRHISTLKSKFDDVCNVGTSLILEDILLELFEFIESKVRSQYNSPLSNEEIENQQRAVLVALKKLENFLNPSDIKSMSSDILDFSKKLEDVVNNPPKINANSYQNRNAQKERTYALEIIYKLVTSLDDLPRYFKKLTKYIIIIQDFSDEINMAYHQNRPDDLKISLAKSRETRNELHVFNAFADTYDTILNPLDAFMNMKGRSGSEEWDSYPGGGF
jgi:hypothetical protein